MKLWRRQFLVADAIVAMALAAALAIWYLAFEGADHVAELLQGNRTNIYRTLAGNSGTLLGLSIASASFTLNAVSSPRLSVLRE